MSTDEHTPVPAVVHERSTESASEMKAYLEQHGMTGARWYDPVAVSSLDKAVRDGRIQRVVFPDMASLFEAIWDEEIVFDAWIENGVQLDFVNPTEVTPASIAGMVYDNWRTWRQRHRRRQAVAGTIISVIVLGLCFIINAVVP